MEPTQAMTDIEQALAEALRKECLCESDASYEAPLGHHEQHAATILATEPMQAIARQAAIGYTVECLPQATATWSIECDPGRLFAADGRLDPDGQPCRFVVDGYLMFEADTPVQLFERIREHMDPEAQTDE